MWDKEENAMGSKSNQIVSEIQGSLGLESIGPCTLRGVVGVLGSQLATGLQATAPHADFFLKLSPHKNLVSVGIYLKLE